MNSNEFDSEFCNVKYVEEDNIVLLTWKKYCYSDNYRTPALFALGLLKKHHNSNFIVDARNGFEDEKEDVAWGFSVLLPEMSETGCKAVVFMMNEINNIEDEMNMWIQEFKKYFSVYKAASYHDALIHLGSEIKKPEHIVVIPIHIKLDCVEKFIEIISANVWHSREEKGVVSFDVIQNKDLPTDFLLIEIYKTPEDQLKHRETEHFQVFKSQVGGLLEEPYQAGIYHSLL